MHRLPTNVWQDEEHLGHLAMRFRGTRQDDERKRIAVEYADTVDRLIQSGSWAEIPTFEDQLPDDWMPQAFYDHWSIRRG